MQRRAARGGSLSSALTGLAPVEGPRAAVLILGSMPGRVSLAAAEYYAHPRNRLWGALAALGVEREASYAERCRQVRALGVALWDVAARCRRERSSLDADIRAAQPNDLAAFHARHPELACALFNGRKARELFDRLLAPAGALAGVELVDLPSTSPANTRPGTSERWAEVLRAFVPDPVHPGREQRAR